jgi:hypothetical protein
MAASTSSACPSSSRPSQALHNAGLRQLRPFPNGIPPVYDGVRVEGILEIAQAQHVLQLVTTESLLQRFHIFPIGIPSVTSFRISVDVGNVPEAMD